MIVKAGASATTALGVNDADEVVGVYTQGTVAAGCRGHGAPPPSTYDARTSLQRTMRASRSARKLSRADRLASTVSRRLSSRVRHSRPS